MYLSRTMPKTEHFSYDKLEKKTLELGWARKGGPSGPRRSLMAANAAGAKGAK